jgi:glycosyltransferase involved in cell wall biosynthesis
MYTFTIGIPVRNGERYLQEALESALKQTRPADEILVVDDASTDETARIARSKNWGGKVRYIYNENPTGFADAFTRVAQHARSDYITFLACDDLLGPDFLLHVENAIERYPTSRHVYTGCHYIDENGSIHGASPEPFSFNPVLYPGKKYSQSYLRSVFIGNNIHRFHGFVIDRHLLLNECPIRKDAGLIMDDDLFVRVGEFTDVVGISQPLVSCRNHSMSETNRLESLSLQLAEDYLFQTMHHELQTSYLDPSDIQLYHELNVRFIRSLFMEGLRVGRKDWLGRALCLRDEFEKYRPGYMNTKLSKVEKVLWKIAHSDRSNFLAFGIYEKLHPILKVIYKFLKK